MLIGSLERLNEIFRRAYAEHEPVIFPTDTIYGIGAPLADKKANEKIFDIKGRDKNKPFPVLVSSFSQAHELAYINEKQLKILKKLWAGRFTFILKAKEHVDSLYVLEGNIALRMPDEAYLINLIEETGAISATSANLSGEEYSDGIESILPKFKHRVKFFSARCTYDDKSSVIIDLTYDPPRLVRGEINLHEILTAL